MMQNKEQTTQGTIHAFDIYDDGVQMGEVYLYFDDADHIVSVSLALKMPIIDEVGIYIIPGLYGTGVFLEFLQVAIAKNEEMVDFIALPRDVYEDYPQVADLGFVPMPFHAEFIYRPL